MKKETIEAKEAVTRLEFPEVSDADRAFGGYPKEWFDKTLAIGLKPEDQKWADLMESLFFKGGTIPINQSLPKDYIRKGGRILRAIMGSFEPKHEHKEVVCALILKSMCEE